MTVSAPVAHGTAESVRRGPSPDPGAYLSEFEELAGVRQAQGPAWLAALQRRAIRRFSELGFPTPRDEEWRFTPVGPITQGVFPLASPVPGRAACIPAHALIAPQWNRVVFVNGVLAPELSSVRPLARGVKLGSLRRALEVDDRALQGFLARFADHQRRPFSALNTALFSDGGALYVPPGVELRTPVQFLFLTGNGHGRATYPRNLVILGKGARATVVETFGSLGSAGGDFSNAVTEILLEEEAALEYGKLQLESEDAFHVGHTRIEQRQNSRLRSFSLAMGGKITRNDLEVVMDGSGVETVLNGLYLGRGRQLVDNHTSILHAHPNGTSRELYKGVLSDHAHGVFNGKVFVKPEAQKTDGKQTNRNLLLSDYARIDTKPQLEIFADDVKCTHGATVGRLDELAGFYLRSRGIGRELARKILVHAFAAEVLQEIPNLELRARLESLVLDRLDEPEAS